MIAAYVRVSSAGQSLKTQKSAIARAAAARGDRVELWFAEKVSGRSLARPELDALRTVARGGGVSKVYVFALDRLVRSGIRDAFAVVEELRHNGCRVASINDPFDLDGPGGEVVLAVLAWAAKQELFRQAERRAAARERLHAAGKRFGRPRRLAPVELAKAQELARQGRSQRSIAMALKVPRSTLQGALSHPPETASGGRGPRSSRGAGSKLRGLAQVGSDELATTVSPRRPKSTTNH